MTNPRLHVLIEPNAIVPLSTVFSLQGVNESDAKYHIKLTIARGNVFHPGQHIVLDASSLSSTTIDSLEFRIGEYNLFEECSLVTFFLHESTHTTLLMGSYNLMAARCQLETCRIGNGNIFQASCHVQIPTIKNGNIFSPMCFLSIQDEPNIQELVFYAVGKKTNVSSSSLSCTFRPHKHGTKKNIAEVGLLLNIVKSIIQSHHPLMPVTMSHQR